MQDLKGNRQDSAVTELSFPSQPFPQGLQNISGPVQLSPSVDAPLPSLIMLLTRVLGSPQSIEIDQRADEKFRRGFIGAPAAAAWSENRQQVPLLARSLRGEWDGWRAGSLHGVRVGVCPELGLEGWLRCVAHPLWWCCVQGACAVPHICSQHPVFAPGSSKVAVRFFGLFISFGSRIRPNCTCTQLFLVP